MNWARFAAQLECASTKAPFTNMSVNVKGKSYTADTVWRVIMRAQWYRTNGTVQGSVTHTVTWYEERFGTAHRGDTDELGCITKILQR